MNAATNRPASEEVVEVSLDQDVMLDMLCNVRRRHAIRHLLSEEQLSLPELVDRVAVDEHGGESSEISRSERKSVYASLRQHHLPRLEDAGLATFDRNDGRVEATDDLRALRPHPAHTSVVDGDAESNASEDDSSAASRRTERPSSDAKTDSPGEDGKPAGDTTEAPEVDSDRPVWVPYYATLCASSWVLATVDALDLVTYEFVTTSEWFVVFLLIFSVLVVLQFRNERPDWSRLPVST